MISKSEKQIIDCENIPIKNESCLKYGIGSLNNVHLVDPSDNSKHQNDSFSASFDDQIIAYSGTDKENGLTTVQMQPSALVNVKQTFKSFKGIFLAFMSSIFFSLTSVIVKELEEVHPGTLTSIRFFAMLLFTLPLASSCGKSIYGDNNKVFLFARGIAGATSLYLRYSAYQLLPIADATVIVLSMPVFVCIFAKIFLKESCGLYHVITLTITLLGIGFTSKLFINFNNSYQSLNLLGLLAAFGATLIGSATYVIVRKLKDVHHSVLIFNFAWVALCESVIINSFVGNFKLPSCGFGPWGLTLLGILSFYGQFFLTIALKNEEAGLVSLIRGSAELAFAFIFQIVIFKEIPDQYSIIGAVLVTFSVILTGLRKWIIMLPQTNVLRKALSVYL